MPSSNTNTHHTNASQATFSSMSSTDSHYALKAKAAPSQSKPSSSKKQLTSADLKKSLHSQAIQFHV